MSFFNSKYSGDQFDQTLTPNHDEKENYEFSFRETKRPYQLTDEVNETEQRRKKHKTQSVLDAQVSRI